MWSLKAVTPQWGASSEVPSCLKKVRQSGGDAGAGHAEGCGEVAESLGGGHESQEFAGA